MEANSAASFLLGVPAMFSYGLVFGIGALTLEPDAYRVFRRSQVSRAAKGGAASVRARSSTARS